MPSPAGAGGAPMPTPQPPSPQPTPVLQMLATRNAQSVLEGLGGDCSAAGRSLYNAGDVQERRDGGNRGMRVFEVRNPLGGTPEVVEVPRGPEGKVATNFAGPDPRPRCSCRLQGHCKHVAAALWALIKEEEARDDEVSACGIGPTSDGAIGRRMLVERRLEKKSIDELKK